MDLPYHRALQFTYWKILSATTKVTDEQNWAIPENKDTPPQKTVNSFLDKISLFPDGLARALNFMDS